MRLRAQAFFFCAAALASACAHSTDNSRAGQTTTTGASFTLPGSTGHTDPSTSTEAFSAASLEMAKPEHPANKLAMATCDRKQECDDIGASKQYASAQACLSATRRQADQTLDEMSCENGLDMKALSACQKEIRKMECAEVDRAKSIEACSRSKLCAR